MDIIIRDRICQNFSLKFHPNLYRLCIISRPLPMSRWIQFFFSSSRSKAPTVRCCIIQYFFMLTLYFVVLRSLGQSYCLNQLDTEGKVNLVLRKIGNYRSKAYRRMPRALISLSSWFQIQSVRVIPLV
jgi:hypothetical protein